MPDTRLNPETAYGHLEASLPFAPGNTFNIDKVILCLAALGRSGCSTFVEQKLENQRKSHAFDYKAGVPVFKNAAPGIGMMALAFFSTSFTGILNWAWVRRRRVGVAR